MISWSASGRFCGSIAAPVFGAALLGVAAFGGGDAAQAQPHPRPDVQATRVLPWDGGERLWIGVPADVRYVEGSNARVVITGPSRQIRRIVVRNGAIRYEDFDGWSWFGFWGMWRPHNRVQIVLTAPRLTGVHLSGSGRLDLGRLSQDRLDLGVSGSGYATGSGAIRSLNVSISGSGGARLDSLSASDINAGISGSGWITAAGTAQTMRLWISGSGHADMGSLSLNDVDASISGSGSAKLAPKGVANFNISGSGGIRLMTEPAKLNVHRSGSGHVSRPNETWG